MTLNLLKLFLKVWKLNIDCLPMRQMRVIVPLKPRLMIVVNLLIIVPPKLISVLSSRLVRCQRRFLVAVLPVRPLLNQKTIGTKLTVRRSLLVPWSVPSNRLLVGIVGTRLMFTVLVCLKIVRRLPRPMILVTVNLLNKFRASKPVKSTRRVTPFKKPASFQSQIRRLIVSQTVPGCGLTVTVLLLPVPGLIGRVTQPRNLPVMNGLSPRSLFRPIFVQKFVPLIFIIEGTLWPQMILIRSVQNFVMLSPRSNPRRRLARWRLPRKE